ncbi:glycosyltransferase family 39 protein [Patescibacteria group bacterium]|nr:glycosyltransferase family 39 protein [Patescibacteria group bacterium]
MLLLTRFSPFTDEAIFFDMTVRLSDGAGLSSSLFRDFIPGVDQQAYWYPPLYFYFLSPIFKIFGANIYVMRIFSLAIASIILILIYQIAHKLFNHRWAGLLSIWILILDRNFHVGAMLGRMEFLVIGFGLGAVLLHLKFLEKRILLYNLLSGICAALALLTHPTAAIFIAPIALNLLLVKDQSWKTKLMNMIFFIIPSIFGVGLWILNFWHDRGSFILQNLLQIHRKQFLETYIWQVFKSLSSHGMIFIGIVLATYLISNVAYLWRVVSNWNESSSRKRLLFLLIISSSILPIMLKEMWYVVFIPLIGSISLSANAIWLWKKQPIILVIAGLAIFLPSLFLYSDAFKQHSLHRNEYFPLSQQVADVLPLNARVLISSLPDPYFYLYENRPDLDMRETPNSPPQEPIDASVYNLILGQVDYVILSYIPNQHLNKYYQDNFESVIFSNKKVNGYSLQVIKLKPTEHRQQLSPNKDEVWSYPLK